MDALALEFRCRSSESIQRERVLLAKLQHPNIVPILDAGDESGRPFLVTEYSNGIDLAVWLRSYRSSNSIESDDAQSGLSLNPANVFHWISQLAGAIHHSHLRGIVHRDIKPSNVIVERLQSVSEVMDQEKSRLSEIPSIPKLTDFGLAKSLTGVQDLTRIGMFIGTIEYASPEQLRGEHDRTGPATDIYSLGVLMFELLTGQLPHKGSSDIQLARHICDEPVPKPSSLRKGLSRDTDAVVLKCLSTRIEDRYATAAELQLDLERLMNGECVVARQPSTLERGIRWARRSLRLAAMLFASIVLMAITLTSLLFANRYLVAFNEVQAISLNRIEKAQESTRHALEIAQASESKAQRIGYMAETALAYRFWNQRQWFEVRRHLDAAKDSLNNASTLGVEWSLLDQELSAIFERATRSTSAIHSIVLLPEDKEHVLTCSESGELVRWNVESMTETSRQTLRPGIFASALSPDGSMLITGGRTSESFGNNKVFAWNMPDLTLREELASAPSSVQSLAFSPDGKYLAIGPRYYDVRVLNLQSRQVTTLPSERRHEWLAFSPDSRQLAVHNSSELAGFDIETGQQCFSQPLPGNGTGLVWTENPSRLLFSTSHPNLTSNGWENLAFLALFDLSQNRSPGGFETSDRGIGDASANSPSSLTKQNGYVERAMKITGSAFTVVTVSKQLKSVAAASDEGRLLFLENLNNLPTLVEDNLAPESLNFAKIESAKENSISEPMEGNCTALAFADENTLLMADQEGNFIRVRPKNRGHQILKSPDGLPYDALWSDDEESIKVFQIYGDTTVISLKSGTTQIVPAPIQSPIGSVTSLDGRITAYFNYTGSIVVSSNATETILYEMSFPHTDYAAIESLQMDSEAKYLVATGNSNWLICWSLVDGGELWRKRLADSGTGIFIESERDQVLVVGRWETIQQFQLSTGQLLSSKNTGNGTNCLLVDKNRGRLLCGHRDNTLRIWNSDLNDQPIGCRGHFHQVSAIAISTDGKTIASCSERGEVRLWDAETGASYGCIYQSKFSRNTSTKLSFSPKSNRLLAVFTERNKPGSRSEIVVWK